MNEVVNKFLLFSIKVSIFYYTNLSNITNLVTKTALTAVKNKTSDIVNISLLQNLVS